MKTEVRTPACSVMTFSGCLPTEELFMESHRLSTCSGGDGFFAGGDDRTFLALFVDVVVTACHPHLAHLPVLQALTPSSKGG